MSRLQVWVTEKDAVDMIQSLATRRKLGAYTLEPRMFLPFDPVTSTAEILQGGADYLYLVPEPDIRDKPVLQSDVAPRYQGWIQIAIGKPRRQGEIEMLQLTTFAAEEHRDLPFKSSNWLTYQKRLMVKDGFLKFGVVPVRFGGERFDIDRSLGYSESAFRLYQSGTKLMQSSGGTVYYEPVEPSW